MYDSSQDSPSDLRQSSKPGTANHHRCYEVKSIQSMEEITNIPPLRKRREYKAMIQTTKYQCSQHHPMNIRLKQVSAGRRKRSSFALETRALQKKHKEVLPKNATTKGGTGIYIQYPNGEQQSVNVPTTELKREPSFMLHIPSSAKLTTTLKSYS